jgi:hypothetical protein
LDSGQLAWNSAGVPYPKIWGFRSKIATTVDG